MAMRMADFHGAVQHSEAAIMHKKAICKIQMFGTLIGIAPDW
jgi:hypothetical protein